jgi:hypothetical protein
VEAIRAALLAMPTEVLAPFGVTRFARVSPADYA